MRRRERIAVAIAALTAAAAVGGVISSTLVKSPAEVAADTAPPKPPGPTSPTTPLAPVVVVGAPPERDEGLRQLQLRWLALVYMGELPPLPPPLRCSAPHAMPDPNLQCVLETCRPNRALPTDPHGEGYACAILWEELIGSTALARALTHPLCPRHAHRGGPIAGLGGVDLKTWIGKSKFNGCLWASLAGLLIISPCLMSGRGAKLSCLSRTPQDFALPWGPQGRRQVE